MNENTWKVLLIDDEEGIRKVMSLTLTDTGYQVFTAADGETGLRICLEKSPHIVVTDIRMPGMDGIEVLKRIKAGHPDREVIVITAFGELELAIRALQLNASDFIMKPINHNALLVALDRAKERYSDRKRAQQERMETQKLQGVLELAGAVCHELNHPMQVVSIYCERWLKAMSKDNPMYHETEKIIEYIDRMAEITRMLQAISKYEARDYIRGTKIVDIDKASRIK
jgi:YesN/AraC family two-component response regulator